MQRNDGSRQLSTYLPTTHLPSAVSPLFADNTTNQLDSYRHQSLHYTYRCFKYRTRHQTSSCVLAETTHHGPCPPAHRMYLPSSARNDSQLVVYHLYLAPRLHTLYQLYVAVAFQKLRVFDLLGIAHVGVTAQGCAFTSQQCRVCDLFRVAHVGVPHRGVRQDGKSNNLIHFPHRGRSHRACRSYRTPVR